MFYVSFCLPAISKTIIIDQDSARSLAETSFARKKYLLGVDCGRFSEFYAEFWMTLS